MDHDYDSIIARYREEYNQLAQSEPLGTTERNSYEQIVSIIDMVVNQEKASSPKQRAGNIAGNLRDLKYAVPEPEAKRIIRQCSIDFNRDTSFEEWNPR